MDVDTFSSSPPRTSSPRSATNSRSASRGVDSDDDVAMQDMGGSDSTNQQRRRRVRRDINQPRRQVEIPTSDVMRSPSVQEDGYAIQGGKGTIWGTNINLYDIHRRFRRFITGFEKNGERLYQHLVQDAVCAELTYINLDMRNLYEQDPELYQQAVNFPSEVLPEFDNVFNAFGEANYAEDKPDETSSVDVWSRPFHLRSVKSMRNMNPNDIDKLVAIRGMVIRCTNTIPDIQTAFFRCILCHDWDERRIEGGRIEEPIKCKNEACQGSHTMTLIHNRCQFQDKQLIKIQETPENIPDGETPQTIDVYVYDTLVDVCRPGDRVEVTGVYRAAPIRKNPRRRTIEAVYKTYIDGVHVNKSKTTQLAEENDDEDTAMTEEIKYDENDESKEQREARIARIEELAADPDIYDRLVRSIAPSIWEMEDVKKGILCQLLGSSNKDFTSSGGGKFRSQMNILLCGDPGTSKSQLLQYVHKIAPRGIYTSGKGSSAVGLTAYITKDHDSGDLVLESGALVLSDKGICCIDEFDKMSDSARSILHEVMEQQTVSIAKAGIICTLNARTSILAAANPIESRYNPSRPVTENIDLPPTLLSRFDLIYLILDRPNEFQDRKLADHIVSLYYDEETYTETQRRRYPSEDYILSQEELTDFISYTRNEIHPKLSDEACEHLIREYVNLRMEGQIYGKKHITATPRQLESLIRISEALAKMRHDAFVREEDVKEAIRLYRVSSLRAATDPRTGAIDLDQINVGISSDEERKLQEQATVILEILKNHRGRTIRVKSLIRKFNGTYEDKEKHLQMNDCKKVVEKLEQSGKVRASDWLNDNPVLTILDTSEL